MHDFGHTAAMAERISSAPRPIDHCVLPVASLDSARERLMALGFTVAPKGVHPFGTANACVYFDDGTFLEPLARGNGGALREAMRAGNMFAARDHAFRYRQGEEGFSALVFGTEDAASDHEAFKEAGFSGGPILDFSRDFVDASGRADKISFRLAFIADWRAPDCFFFTCQRINAPKVDRSALQRHENGVTHIKTIAASAPRADDFADFVSVAAKSAAIDRTPEGEATVEVSKGRVELLSPAVMRERFGGEPAGGPGLQLRAIVFGVRDPGRVQTLLKTRGIAYEIRGRRLIAHPAPGQGAIFAFEAE